MFKTPTPPMCFRVAHTVLGRGRNSIPAETRNWYFFKTHNSFAVLDGLL